MKSNIGERLKLIENYLEGEDYFLANYADGLTDLPLPVMINEFKESGKVGSFICVKPSQSFSIVSFSEGNGINSIKYVKDTDMYINGGYFVFKKEIFDYMKDGEELVVEPFERLISENKLMGYKYDAFWHCMDTFKEQKELNELYEQGRAPWELWAKPQK